MVLDEGFCKCPSGPRLNEEHLPGVLVEEGATAVPELAGHLLSTAISRIVAPAPVQPPGWGVDVYKGRRHAGINEHGLQS